MFHEKMVFGKVIDCSQENTLTVLTDDGETGMVRACDISSREISGEVNMRWRIGRRFGFMAGKPDENGILPLSGREYENELRGRIAEGLESGERNLYIGKFVSVTADGRLAFYSIGQGINGALRPRDFALTRFKFDEIFLPRELPVAIREMDEAGRINLYAKMNFGDFEYGLERLGLKVGSVVNGYVSGSIGANEMPVVTLSPNMTVLTNRTSNAVRVEEGSFVKVEIERIDTENQRLNGRIVDLSEVPADCFDFDAWRVSPEALRMWVDIDAFEQKVGPVPRKNAANVIALRKSEVDISYELTTEKSPFALCENEKLDRLPLNGGNAAKIQFEVKHGYLNDKHLTVARAINCLHYTTAYQVQRYLDSLHSIRMSVSELSTVIERLIKLDIVQVMKFRTGERQAVTKILYPGSAHYRTYTGELRFIPTWEYGTEPDPERIKRQLSANQLLLGVLHGSDDIKRCVSRVYLSGEGLIPIRPRHQLLRADGSEVYLESVRGGEQNEAWMLGKLTRYARYLEKNEEHLTEIIVTMEREDLIESFAERVAALHLKFDVLLTSDLQCLPVPILRRVPGSRSERKGFLKLLDHIDSVRNFFKEAVSA